MNPCQADERPNREKKSRFREIGSGRHLDRDQIRRWLKIFVGDRLAVPRTRQRLDGTAYGKKLLSHRSDAPDLM